MGLHKGVTLFGERGYKSRFLGGGLQGRKHTVFFSSSVKNER
nr:MAG TPA: hypothetical protein [Caudoviricetes sp.]